MKKRLNLPHMHKTLNDILTGIVALVILFIFVQPWLPSVTWQFRSKDIEEKITQKVEKKDVPDGHRLFVPRLGMDQEIFDGPTAAELNKGVWRRPNTSTPPQHGNTVLAGHRFRYTSAEAVFYHLDKIQAGDKLYVAWDNVLYTYSVDDISIVNPTDVWVEDPTRNAQLVLYTCTPLWTSNQRLVITAGLQLEEEER